MWPKVESTLPNWTVSSCGSAWRFENRDCLSQVQFPKETSATEHLGKRSSGVLLRARL